MESIYTVVLYLHIFGEFTMPWCKFVNLLTFDAYQMNMVTVRGPHLVNTDCVVYHI